ncbi:MAG: SRPBCC family protein [Deltaproteobacteria bacterium]|nr:SRPBCC family protein [Deltaproteobacteria bacterium]
MATTTVRGAAAIPLPIGTCWEKMRDLRRAKDYVPGLSDCVVTTTAQEGVGASRVVTHSQFGAMNESVVVWDEGRGMTLRLHKGDKPARPFAEAYFRYEFRPARAAEPATGGGASGPPGPGCEIHTALLYRLPLGPVGRLLDALFLRRLFQQNVVDAAVCLAENYRTDRPVPAAEIPRLRKNALPSCP